MKILYVTNMYPNEDDPNYGIFVKEQIEAIERIRKIEKVVYVIDGKKGFGEYIKSVYRIRRVIRKGDFDLVHVHYGLSGLFLLLWRINAPVIMTLHGGDIQAEQGKTVQVALTKRILKKCDFAITLNDRMDEIARRYIHHTDIVPCSVNTNLFRELVKKDITHSVQILFPSARSRVVKDFPLFEKTCELLRQQFKLDVKEYYLENLSRNQVAELFNKMDVLLMTSISEGSPQVVKEAMACNLPVVSTDVGDVGVLLDGVKDSYVAKNREPKELADLVFISLSRGNDGISPRDKIKQLGLDDDSIAQRILTIYSRLINGNNERA